LYIGDYVLIKIPSQDFFFRREGATSSWGTVTIIDNYDPLPAEIYYLIKLTSSKLAGTRTIDLNNIRNPGKD